MKEQPLVSIITPCYNCEKYIQRYIDYILNQEYSKIELIFINDGSSDNTETILKNNKERIEKRGFKYIYVYQNNKGLGGAINTGLKHVNGDFFTWCDSDNFYTNDYVLEKVKYFIENPECNVLRCGGNIVNDGEIDVIVGKLGDGEKEKDIKKMFYNAILEKDFHFGCAMLRTSAFDKVNPHREIYESREGQNWQLLLPMLYYYDAHYINKEMFNFVYRKESISNITKQKGIEYKLEQIEEYKKILITTIKNMNIPEEKELIEMVQDKYKHIILNIAKEYGDIECLKKQYKELKKERKITWRDRATYMTARYKILDKLKNILKLCMKGRKNAEKNRKS